MSKDKYKIVSYQSGTMWLKFTDLERRGGFHFSYFRGDNYDDELYINDRSEMERNSYARGICAYLNESAEYLNSRVKPYVGWVKFGKVTQKGESTLIFHDAYFGTLQIDWRIVRGDSWDLEPIPDDVLSDLKRFIERAGSCFEHTT